MNNASHAPGNEPEKTEVIVTNNTVESDPPTPPLAKKTKSKKKIVIVIVAVLVIALVAVLGYMLFSKLTAPKVVEDTTGYGSATKFESSQKLVESANLKLSGQTVEITQMDGFGGKTADGFGAYSVPTHKVGDRKYSNLPASSKGSSYRGNSVDASENYSALVTFFKNNKFKEVSSGSNTDGINQWFTQDLNYVSYATYESSNILCMIWHVDATPTSVKEHVTSIGCADKSSYELAAKNLDQFYTAYAKGGQETDSKVVLGVPTASIGTADYANATVYMEDPDQLDTQFQGLYYRQKDDDEWTYFTGAYGLLSCSDYNTDVLKQAFKGFNCWNEASRQYATV